METTDRFGLPLLVPGQAQKEVTLNESIILIDSLIALVVERTDLAEPPAERTAGLAWVVAAPAGGEWTGMEGRVAVWTGAGWRFLSPREGMTFWDRAGGRRLRRIGDRWQVDLPVDAPSRSIAAPQGGETVDSEARDAIGRILERLRETGFLEP